MDFVGAHVLSVDQFERRDIERVFAVADEMRPCAAEKEGRAHAGGAGPVATKPPRARRPPAISSSPGPRPERPGNARHIR